ncbi:integrator complex subunit 4 [Dorcoceras hygrometricum]|uniref:Integrator complex subunit 4 n=1 Tax=Dorcoceras hygrometricum TaxID=472368 RepID=A0A2Z7CNU8_9LAMI|nr:integrator complex subunit 4 [Dorcoceras hygrometricum]
MEHRLLSDVQSTLSENPEHAFMVALSLITNPFTSNPTISSLLDTLILNLQNCPNKVLPLLATISLKCPQLSSRIISAVQEFIFLPSVRIASLPHALSLLLTDHSYTIGTDPFCDESLFLSLCFWQCVKSRRWVTKNVGAFHVRPSVLLTVLLGITKDPYPCVRGAALDGLVTLSNHVAIDDKSLVECCYFRATELLFDVQKSVRCAAVRVVCEWGQLLVALNQEKCKRDWSDAVFIQLCLMARDMDMNIRVSAFDALGKIQMVSEDLLMQCLSKKALDSTKEKNYPGRYTVKLRIIPASAIAFTFVQGLQDEFHEVRRSACCALQKLMAFSSEFTCEAVHVLMDILNDDSTVVRLQALETLRLISLRVQLKVEESHLHMVKSCLMDGSAMIRSASRKVIQSIKLPKLKMFRLCTEALMKNLELYPLDEADVFSVLYKIGRTHGKYVACIIQEVLQELEPSFDGKLGFHNTRTAALLVLAISAPVSFDREICSIPPQVFSYAVTLLGRISNSLLDLLDQSTLFYYLSRCSKFTAVSASEFFKGELLNSQPKNSNDDFAKMSDWIYAGCSDNLIGLKKVTTPYLHHLNSDDAATSYTQVIFQQVRDLWPMIQLGYMDEVIQTLRNWKFELKRLNKNFHQSTGILSFTMKYLNVIKLYGKAWAYYLSRGDLQFNGTDVLEALLQKTERRLKEMLHRFLDLGREEELHILEFTLVTRTLRLSSGATCCFNACMIELKSAISRVEQLHRERSIELSDFITELQNACEIGKSKNDATDKLYLFQASLDLFSPKHIVLSGEIKYMVADVNIFENSFENPITFVPGLPVGLSLEITLYNISCEARLWLTMTLTEKSTQFIFLNFHEFGECNEMRKFPFVAPFYRTPKVRYFSIKISIGMECLSDVQRLRHKNGPKHELIQLCEEKEVHLSLAQ